MNKVCNYIKIHKKIILYIIIILLIIIFFLLKSGVFNHLETTHYTYTSSKLPDKFDNFKIAQLSDWHLQQFGEDNCNLISAIKEFNPDCIAITGDLINDDIEELPSMANSLDALSKIAPGYFICGNHDMPTWQDYLKLTQFLYQYNIVTIDNQTDIITRDNQSIYISGLFSYKEFSNISISQDNYNVLLYHYANEYDYLKQFGFDLILSGHTHGGIIRLPFIGGLLGTEMNLFPKYDGGINYDKATNTTMITSRGLGEAFIPRFNNNPEVVFITLKCGDNTEAKLISNEIYKTDK